MMTLHLLFWLAFKQAVIILVLICPLHLLGKLKITLLLIDLVQGHHLIVIVV